MASPAPSYSSSLPHSTASVSAAIKSLGRSPFFHAGLQSGSSRNTDDEADEQVSLAKSSRSPRSLSPSSEAGIGTTGAGAGVAEGPKFSPAGRVSNNEVITAAGPGAASLAYAHRDAYQDTSHSYLGLRDEHQHPQQQAPNSFFSSSGNGCDESPRVDAPSARGGVPSLKVNVNTFAVVSHHLRAQPSASSFSSSSNKPSPHTAATHFSSSSIRYPSSGPNSAMPANSTADPEFWRGVENATEAALHPPAGPRPHYLTRSQSTGSYQPAATATASPKVRKKGSSSAIETLETPQNQFAPYNPSSLRSEVELNEPESVDITSGAGLLPNHKQLSPINESPFSDEYRVSPIHGDTASINSVRSERSKKLFINRPVRRTGSTSSFNSQLSLPPRGSPDEGGTGAFGAFRNHRTPLSMIPGSPRVSNVHDIEPGNADVPDDVLANGDVLSFPLPTVHPPDVHYGAFPRTADEMRDAELRHSNAHTKTPSLLTMSRSASQSTQLTYLTADEAGNVRRSRVDSGVAGRRSRLAGSVSPRIDGDGDQNRDPERADNASIPRSAAARLRTSIEDLLTKSSKMTSSAMKKPIAGATPTFRGALTILSTAHAPWAAPQSKPSEVLFWTGFIAPWCWLIGGWMLSRSGETVMDGLPSGTKEEHYTLPMYRDPNAAETAETHEQMLRGLGLGSRSQSPARFSDMQTQTQQPSQTQMTEGKGESSYWGHAKNSSTDLLSTAHVDNENDRLKQKGEGTTAETATMVGTPTRLDPWVVRCRIAAVISGMLLLALLIVALVVLIRAL